MVEGWTKNLLSEMMVNSVTWKMSAQFPDRPKWRRAGARACNQCIRGGGLQARANLNGGELDEGPILPERRQPDVS